MSSLNRIESKHVNQLKPHQLVRLLSKLLYSEAKKVSAEVHVPLEIDVNDAGEDGRWKGEVGPNEYVPNKLTLYQSKAQALSPSQCKAELLKAATKKPELKESVAEVLDAKGCYVFFCGHSSNPSLIKKKIAEARKGLRQAGRKTWKTDRLLFLDANKIAAWTNLHTSAVIFVAECCGIRLPENFRTWENWHKDPANRSRFYSNAKLDQCAASLRVHLIQSRSIARISGLSGLGKSRLAFETLRPPANSSDLHQQMLSNTTAYIDLEENNQHDVLAIVRQLADAGYTGTLVVDNCSRSVHDSLAKIISMQDSQLSLLTLDYEPETITAGFLHIPLAPEMMLDVIPSILKELPQAKTLTEPQLQRIASFAFGFPQIAVLMAAAGDTLDWAHLNQGRLAEKIAYGKAGPTEKSRQVIRSLALFTHVGFAGGFIPQREFVREQLCQNISEHEFLELCRPFQQRRVLQSAGDYSFVAPPPLAVALAADWWESATEQQLIDLFPLMEKCGLRPSFCNQVERLHFSQNAQVIAAKLCGGGGPLADAEVLNTVAGSQLFRAMVELNPSAAVDCIHRVFVDKAREKLLEIRNGRRNLIWALEKLCWDRVTFAKAAEVLLNFASAETENILNSATGQFKQLFHVYLSGTQTPAIERLTVIEDGLQSKTPEKIMVCIEALGAALEAHHFSRSGGVEVRGSGLPQNDWSPRIYGEVYDYWSAAVELLKRVILERSEQSALAKETLGNNLWGILKPQLLERFEPAFKEVAAAENHYWPEALSAINRVFEHMKSEHTPESLRRLERWREWITPNDIEHQLELIVSRAPYEHKQTEDGHFIDVAEENAVRLADDLIERESEWIGFLPRLLQGEQRQAWQFGRRFGELHSAPSEFISKCLSALREISSDKQNAGLLIGILAGIKSRDLVRQTLDRVQADELLRPLLVKIIVGSRPQKEEFERIVGLVAADKLPPESLRWFSYGSVTDSLTPQELIAMFEPLARQKPEARAPIFNISYMFVFHIPERWQQCRSFIKKLISSEGFLKSIDSSHDGYEWEEHVKKILNEESDEQFALNQTKQILEAQENRETRFALDLNARNVLSLMLEKYSPVCWPLIGEMILSEKWYLLSMLFKHYDFEKTKQSPLWSVPLSIVTDWAREHQPAIVRIFEISPLFRVDEDGSYSWHPTILALLEIGFDERWRSAISVNLYSYGSWGSRVPYVEKRIALLRQLETHHNPQVRKMAMALIGGFEVDREREAKSDEERAAGIF